MKTKSAAHPRSPSNRKTTLTADQVLIRLDEIPEYPAARTAIRFPGKDGDLSQPALFRGYLWSNSNPDTKPEGADP